MSQDNSKDCYQSFLEQSHLFGGNAPFVEELYQRFLDDPTTVETEWRVYFEQLQKSPGPAAADVDHNAIREEFFNLAHTRRGSAGASAGTAVAVAESKQVAVLQLINAYRVRGHQQANLDPLGLQEQTPLSELDPAFHALTEADMDTVFSTGSLVGLPQAKLREILSHLQDTYCRSIGAEYMHITDSAQKRWVQQQMEGTRGEPKFSPKFRRHILRKTIAAEGLEQYLHTKYVGQKRFSLEGGETLIPLLDEIIWRAGGQGVKEAVIGMAHRGRLNVLVNIMGKNPAHLFQEFEGVCDISSGNSCGDVKYHQGFSSNMKTSDGVVHLALAFNPSHLEIVNPVVEGSVRARQHRRRDLEGSKVLPVLIHGDAAFAGQGVVMETLNMSQARGFTTGGTVHVIINNQIGFTTSNPVDARSTMYCTEVARMIQAPIFHVNGDDPEAVIFVTQLALDYRQQFKRDVVIDLVCYRRHGHNEADEPAVTQPIMYQVIRKHPTTVKLYVQRLIDDGVITQDDADRMLKNYRDMLDAGQLVSREIVEYEDNEFAVNWGPYTGILWTEPCDTRLPMKNVQAIAEAITTMPEGFELHSRAAKVLDDRRKMAAGELPFDWGFAENLAYGSLLLEGHPIRLSGQDSGRGTFFHRHAVFHNQKERGSYVPLQNLSEDQAHFRVIDSLLSEEAVLGYEYGYAGASPESLVIWEAQFGDFANGAQVVIDQFISAGEVKWGRLCGLVMLLPHGYDGQGPEHSSARLERYLQLCAGNNMQVCYPTTPAQMFHMMRRQAIRPYRKPLIVMSPKSLLRHKLSTSSLDDITKGQFEVVIDEVDAVKADQVKRIVMCSGKVYFDLLEKRRELNLKHVALVRVEQLYPFPEEALKAVLARYNQANEIVWCQEEPRNQGAWYFMHPRLRDLTTQNQEVLYAGRPEYAAPAEGLLQSHLVAQAELVDAALNGEAGLKKSVSQAASL